MILSSKTVSTIRMRKQNTLGTQRSEQNLQLILKADHASWNEQKTKEEAHLE